jgi:hypothetical protein
VTPPPELTDLEGAQADAVRAAARQTRETRTATLERWATQGHEEMRGAPPPPCPRTNRTRRVPHPVLIGHAASLTPY